MALEAVKVPDFGGNGVESEIIHLHDIYYDHDIIIGRLILGKDRPRNEGANIYVVNEFPKDPSVLSPALFFDLANDTNLRSRILPYLREEMPTHFDDGRAATLNFWQYPSYIAVLRQQSELSSD